MQATTTNDNSVAKLKDEAKPPSIPRPSTVNKPSKRAKPDAGLWWKTLPLPMAIILKPYTLAKEDTWQVF